MKSISRFIFLISSLTVTYIPNASAALIDPTKGGIHRRNDASDDELEIQLRTASNSKRLDELDDDFFSLDPLSNSNIRELEELNGYFFSPESDAQHAHTINHKSNALLSGTKKFLQKDLKTPFEHSDEGLMQFPHDRKRRRISPESKETAGLKTTGLDLPDASDDGNDVLSFKLKKDHDDKSATKPDDRGTH